MASEHILTLPASQAREFVALTRRSSMGGKEISAEILGKPVRCGHCGHDRFMGRSVQVTGDYFRIGFANVYVCRRCGHLEWFLRSSEQPLATEKEFIAPQEFTATQAEEPITCIACDAPIPASVIRCPACGWSYVEDAG
jgi:predicted nucleic-acid-binding Zn-ribbon protein